MPQTSLYLVRHGATEANLHSPPILQGQRTDMPLAEAGRQQARAVAGCLEKYRFDAVFSSPLRRAAETAEWIAGPAAAVVGSIDELTECDVGEWEGLSWEQIQRTAPEQYRRFWDNPAKHGYLGGESLEDVHARIGPAVEPLLRGDAGDVVVVTHNLVCRVLLASLISLPLKYARNLHLDNCGLSIVVTGSKPTVRTINAVDHLRSTNEIA